MDKLEGKGRPNKKEILFLSLSYGRFYDLYDEIMEESFWDKSEWNRFSKITQAFSIYNELLFYEPIKWSLEKIKETRPPMESVIADKLFRFIRNVLAHFSFYTKWNEVWVNKDLVNWKKDGQFIHKFLSEYSGKEDIKYRFWEDKIKEMTYLSIRFPKGYIGNSKIYLKDMLSEKDGVKFSIILMRQIINIQVESTKGK